MIVDNHYKTLQSHECLNACLLNYFTYEGYSINGYDILFGGEGFCVQYEEKEIGLFLAPAYQSNFNFLNQEGILFKQGKYRNFLGRNSFLREMIHKEEMISIRVASHMLDYNPVFRQTRFAPHFINLIGINERENKICISDGAVPTANPSTFQGWVDGKMILHAWGKMNYEYIILEKFKEGRRSDITVSEGQVKKQIVSYMQGESNENIFFGVAAVEKLEKLLLKSSLLPENNRKEIALNINYQIKTYGFLSGKCFLLEYMIKKNVKEDIILEYQSIIKGWKGICLFILKAGMARDTTLMETAAHRMRILNEKEKLLLKKCCNEVLKD